MVCLSKSLAPANAPASSNASRTAALPLAAAMCVARVPFSEASFGSAPAFNSAATASHARVGSTLAAAARRYEPRGVVPDFKSERIAGTTPSPHAARAHRSSESPPSSSSADPSVHTSVPRSLASSPANRTPCAMRYAA